MQREKSDSPTTPFDVSASLLRSEKLYEQIMLDAAKRLQKEDDDGDDSTVTMEYVIAARDKTLRTVLDWVPIAQLCLARSERDARTSEGSSAKAVIAAVASYRRELSHVASLGSRVFAPSNLPRHDLEYSVEPVDSFHKFVYEPVMEQPRQQRKKTDDPSSGTGGEDRGSSSSSSRMMTTEEARIVLQIRDDAEGSLRDVVKKQYRKRSFECHPDRVAGSNGGATEEYSKVQLAYETLLKSSELVRESGASWYASLGGRARTDFVGPIDLQSITKEEAAGTELASCKSAIIGLDPDMVQSFVARSLAKY